MKLINTTNSHAELVKSQLESTDATLVEVYSAGNSDVVFTQAPLHYEILISNTHRAIREQEIEKITNTLPTFEECFYSNDSFPFENQTLEKLRRNGIDIELGTPFEDLLDYGIKVVPGNSKNQTYENVEAISYCGQF